MCVTTDPYERLRAALQSGRLRATVVEESLEEAALTERDLGMDEWLDFDALADPSEAIEAPYHVWSHPARYAVLVSREETVRAEAELSAAEAERPVWKLEQALGWIAYRRDQSFRSLGRIDQQSPTFFGQSYKKDFVEPTPLATLRAALLSDRLHAYVHGVALTRAECISLLSEKDGLWGEKDLVFSPDEVREHWKRLAGISSKSSSATKDRALADLIAHLKERPEKRDDARDWLKARYPRIGVKAFLQIWKLARAAIGPAWVGRPPKAPRLEATPQPKS